MLTTTAFDRSRLKWFEARFWKPTPRGHPSSLMQLCTQVKSMFYSSTLSSCARCGARLSPFFAAGIGSRDSPINCLGVSSKQTTGRVGLGVSAYSARTSSIRATNSALTSGMHHIFFCQGFKRPEGLLQFLHRPAGDKGDHRRRRALVRGGHPASCGASPRAREDRRVVGLGEGGGHGSA